MGIRKVTRGVVEEFDPRAAVMATREYVGLGRNIKDLEARRTAVKKRLAAAVEQYGVEDDRGHSWLPLEEEADGVKQLKRERRVGQSFSEDTAIATLDKHGLLESCSKTVRMVDDEAVMAAHYEGKLTEDEIDAMYPKKVTYAFVVSAD